MKNQASCIYFLCENKENVRVLMYEHDNLDMICYLKVKDLNVAAAKPALNKPKEERGMD